MIQSLRLAAGLTAALLSITALAAPAGAAPGFDPLPGGSSSSGRRAFHRIPGTGCAVFGSGNGFGASCHATKGKGLTAAQILQQAGIPDCWNEPPPPELADDYAAMRQRMLQQGQQGDYWVRICVTFDAAGDPVLNSSDQWIPAGQKPVLLSHAQRDLVAERRQHALPAPQFQLSPLHKPRVGQWVAFNLLPLPTTPDPTPYEVRVTRDGVQLTVQARLDHTEFYPVPGTLLPCLDGGVAAGPADTPQTLPAACWWRYPHSSAGRPGQTYPVQADAFWQIWYQAGAAWQRLPGVFRKYLGQVDTSVTEIQTVVVP